MVQRLTGSPDMYHGRGPTASINFITCHDGFTLADLFSYNDKHNEANGEDNRDGNDINYSWNCGAEGPANDPAVLTLRRRQMKNAMTILLISHGVPMFGMGDEVGRTQLGNNNAYCHDSPLTWFDWTLTEQNAEMLRFCQLLIAFRKEHPALRQPRHVGTAKAPVRHEIEWHGVKVKQPDWGPLSRTLAFELRHQAPGEKESVLYAVMNMYWKPLVFQLPVAPFGTSWRKALDTAARAPRDIMLPSQRRPLRNTASLRVMDRAVVVLTAR